MAATPRPQKGVLCAGCPHRGAYLAAKNATRGMRGRVICGDVGCPAVGYLYPAAATCPGGMERLLPRYKQEVPTEPAPVCVHFTRDTAVMRPGTADASAAEKGNGAAGPDQSAGDFSAAALSREGQTAVLGVLASSANCVTQGQIEALGQRLLDLGYGTVVIVDPLDTERAEAVLRDCLAAGGASAVVFASPCTLLMKERLEAAEVDHFTCVGCHRCWQVTGCPALSFTPPAYRIDPELCAGCDLCVGTCRTQVIYTPRLRMTPEERNTLRYQAVRG